MNIEKLIASIPVKTAEERKTMRANAKAKLASGAFAWAAPATALIEAIDRFEREQRHQTEQRRADGIASAADVTLVECIITAFEIEPPTELEDRLIQTLLNHPGSTCADLSALHGWAPTAWDLQYGAMCARRAHLLWPLEPSVREGDQANINFLTRQERGPDEALRYWTRPEALEAFVAIGFKRARQ